MFITFFCYTLINHKLHIIKEIPELDSNVAKTEQYFTQGCCNEETLQNRHGLHSEHSAEKWTLIVKE